MSLQEYGRVLRERWLTLLVVTVLGLLGGGAAFWLQVPVYTARTTLYVASSAVDVTGSFQAGEFAQKRVKSYVEVATSTRVAREVVDRLQLPTTPELLAQSVVASTPSESVLLNVAVEDTSAVRAASIANAIDEVLPEVIAEMEKSTAPAPGPTLSVRVLEPAAEPTAPSSTGLPVLLAIGLLVGLGLGVGAALLRHSLDPRVRGLKELSADAPMVHGSEAKLAPGSSAGPNRPRRAEPEVTSPDPSVAASGLDRSPPWPSDAQDLATEGDSQAAADAGGETVSVVAGGASASTEKSASTETPSPTETQVEGTAWPPSPYPRQPVESVRSATNGVGP